VVREEQASDFLPDLDAMENEQERDTAKSLAQEYINDNPYLSHL